MSKYQQRKNLRKKMLAPKFGQSRPKLGLQLGFLSFFQVWFISFPGNCIECQLGKLSKIVELSNSLSHFVERPLRLACFIKYLWISIILLVSENYNQQKHCTNSHSVLVFFSCYQLKNLLKNFLNTTDIFLFQNLLR